MSEITDANSIYIKKTIIHILDSNLDAPILSEKLFEQGSNFQDFLKKHLFRLLTKDDVKMCEFLKSSKISEKITNYSSSEMIKVSKYVANHLFSIMSRNIDVPRADLLVVEFKVEDEEYLGFLKMNYEASYIHKTKEDANDIALNTQLIPSRSTNLTEAAIINLSTLDIRMVEKKYEVNGEKTNYFSSMFLGCTSNLSCKKQLTSLKKVIEEVQREYGKDGVESSIRFKAKLSESMEEEGTINISKIKSEIFDDAKMKDTLNERLDKYKLSNVIITPRTEVAKKIVNIQKIATDTGIEIMVPLSNEDNKNKIKFVTEEDGSISITIKNIGTVIAK